MKKEKDMKEYLEFIEKFRQYVTLMTEGWGMKITFQRADEAEDREEDLLIVEMGGSAETGIHMQRFHMEDIYEDYENGRELNEILQEVSDLLEQCKEIRKINPLGHLGDYLEIRKQLVLRPLNYDQNRKKLQDGIYEVIGDVALVLYVSIGNFKGIYTSSMVPRNMLEKWKREKSEVLEAAKWNTYELFPPRIFNWFEADRLEESGYGEFMSSASKPDIKKGPFGTFVTTKNHCNGAVSVFLPGVARRLSELMGSDLYIAFLSMHEAVVHDSSATTVEHIRHSLAQIDRDFPAGEDFLSGRVYCYNREKDRITVV